MMTRTFTPIQRRQLPVKTQRGVALISVLLAVALCVILASEMLMQQSLQVKRVQNLFERQQAYWYANGSEQFVKTLLKKIIDDDKGVIHLEQSWAMTGMSFPVLDGLIEGQIFDLQSCFNINSLYNADWQQNRRNEHKQVFVRLLDKLDMVKNNSSDDLANNVYDWLDPDEYPVGAVGYDGDMYTSMAFPYLAANSPFAHENELRLVYGFDAAVMAQLDNTICAIPDYAEFEININTIDQENPAVLAAVLDIDNSEAENILAQRPKDGFKDIQEFWQLNEVKSLKNLAQIEKTQFTVKSKFFKLVTNAYYNDMRFELTSVLQLNGQNEFQVIARRFGGKVERKADPETEQSDN